jgi:ATP-binding cassette subfamily B protein AbcA/BmrA
MKKYKKFLKDVVLISRVTGTDRKKIRVFYSVILSNATVVLDIAIIIVIANLFTNDNKDSNFLIDFLMENTRLLPLIIILRFFIQYIQKIILLNLTHEVDRNLRVYLLREAFDKGNYSISDAFFFINTLSVHISSFYGSLSTLLNSILQIVLYASFLIYTDLRAVLVFLIGAVLFAFPTKYFTDVGRRYSHENYIVSKEASTYIQRVLDNMFLIKIFKKIDPEVERYENELNKFIKASINNQKVGNINANFPGFTTYFLMSILLIFFNFAAILTLEFIGILIRLFQELSNLNRQIMMVSNTNVHFKEFYKIQDNRENKYKNNYLVTSNAPKDKSIVKFENVEFKYFNSDLSIFKNLDLEIPRNQHTIITGPNGSGKSTLLGLISGIFYAQDGKVKVGTQKLGYVGVTPLIINSSLRENLSYGLEKDVPDTELLNIAKQFKLFNEKENYDLDKNISNKTLSSGQMQKISFIRSLLSEVDILLLDESTSNLDQDTKKLIFNILSSKNLTIINSTHSPDEFKGYDNHIKIEIKDEMRYLDFI